ncbi:PEP-CTERM sorting domain-containing protein [Luteolibacter ambystomatis]|uniref:PEP-CTERM sorting domain-containing protein n=1 Tax=Luteolibacter ambystomatis TaxID=2824561 RepID=A0A975G5I7_9BACT|nr:PEP-CTERM sorting domain-containing protein [Luteolibacter ambystomatis]QUE49353.1 PEP-CTERM sorting domain-containing protein [Luteolibacter ambystomatis]
MTGGTHAAIVAINDTFAANTLANYTAAGGYTLSYNASGSPDFGDGAGDGFLNVNVPASNNTGSLVTSLGTVDAEDVGKQLTLVFRLDGRSVNFHSDNVSFTVNATVVPSTTVSTTTFPEWDNAGTAATGAGAITDWRMKNAVGTLSYTIQAADVGNTLGWKFASASTSSGGYSFGIDNWSLSVVPEPSSSLLALAGCTTLMLRRRR